VSSTARSASTFVPSSGSTRPCSPPPSLRPRSLPYGAVGLEPCIYVGHPSVDIVVSDNPATCPAHLAYISGVAGVDDLDTTVAARPVYAFSVLGLARDRLEPAAHLLRDHGVQIMLYAEPVYGAYGLIVNPPGVSKWSGVDANCRLAGIDPTEVLAAGDGDNDLAMLTRAGVAMAVKDGTTSVLEVADHIIGPRTSTDRLRCSTSSGPDSETSDANSCRNVRDLIGSVLTVAALQPEITSRPDLMR
jgi:hypothetical protein